MECQAVQQQAESTLSCPRRLTKRVVGIRHSGRPASPSVVVATTLHGVACDPRNPDTVGPETRFALRILTWALLLVCALATARGNGLDLAVDGRGNYLVVGSESNHVLLARADGSVSPIKGPFGNPITFDDRPTAIAFDQYSSTAYVSDFDEVFSVTAQGLVSRVAGDGNLVWNSREAPSGGLATAVPLRDIVAMEFDTLSDTLFIAEYGGRILALQDDRIRLHAGNHAQDGGVIAFLPPVRDIALAHDGSLYVLGRDRVWHIPTGGSTDPPVGYREGNANQREYGLGSAMRIPGIVSVTTRDNTPYVSTVRGEVVQIAPDGSIETFGSGEVTTRRIEFAPSGLLALASGGPSEFKIVEVGQDGTVSRVLPQPKPADVLTPRRIIGGRRVSPYWEEMMAVVAVELGDGRSCTGSLISDEWVLTAVHCVDGDGPFTVSTCNDLYDDCLYREIPVRNVHFHPRYYHRGFLDLDRLPRELLDLLPPDLPRAWPFDVALLQLEHPMEGITPIEIADFTTEQYLVHRRRIASQVGWGNTNYSLTQTAYPDHKRLIQTPIRLPDSCTDFLAHSPQIRSLAHILDFDRMLDKINDLDHPLWNAAICAGSPEPPIELASWGDSGGPLLQERNGRLVHLGTLSTSRPRLSLSETRGAEFLNIYTRTSAVYDWIVEVTGIGGHTVPQENLYDDSEELNFEQIQECSVCPRLTVLPPGKFDMGAQPSETGEFDEGPRQRLRINHRFAIGTYEVTFRQWYQCVDEGGCNLRPADSLRESAQPVVNVNYHDAIEYVMWLSKKTGRPYRLPTEAEWEYAARAGTSTPYYTGAKMSTDYANFFGKISTLADSHHALMRLASGSPTAVGSFPPNPWGIYDTAGNVYEWVQDCWRSNLFRQDPFGASWQMSDCSRRAIRGGFWASSDLDVRSTNRKNMLTHYRYKWLGFRVARTLRDVGPILREDDYADYKSGASGLHIGTSKVGVLEDASDVDWFRLEVADTTYALITVTGRVRAWKDIDGWGNLFGGLFGGQKRILLEPGDHYFALEPRDSTRKSVYYSISAEQVSPPETPEDRLYKHPDSSRDAKDLPLDRTVSGIFDRGRDEDWFMIRVDHRTNVTLYTTGKADTVGKLFDHMGTRLRSDDDSGSNLNFQINITLDPDTYFLQLTSHGSDYFRYRLHAERNEALEFKLNQPIEYNGETLAKVESIVIGNSDQDDSRISVSVSVLFENFPERSGKFFPKVFDDGCSKRGIRESDPLIHSRGSSLKVVVRMRLQYWTCFGGKKSFTWYNKQKDMIIRLSTAVRWGRSPYIEITPILETIRYYLFDFDVFQKRIRSMIRQYKIRIPIPWDATGSACSAAEVQRLLGLRFETIEFSGEGDDVRLVAKFSLDRQLNQALRCLPLPSGR